MTTKIFTEKLLQFIWLYRLYQSSDLTTICGKKVYVEHPGKWNHEQGPDFLFARVRIDDILFIGGVEIHIDSGDWYLHQHDKSKHYRNVILHVVYHHNTNYPLPDIPTLNFEHRIARSLLEHYARWMNVTNGIACHAHQMTLPEMVWDGWMLRLVQERLETKRQQLLPMLEASTYNWHVVTWQWLMMHAAPGMNTPVFEAMAKKIPFTIIQREHHIHIRIEAIFLGMAGLLEGSFQTSYPILLQKEFQLMQHKYQLEPVDVPVAFLRMRPANFPTIRLSQLAQLFHLHPHLFQELKKVKHWKEILNLFHIKANDYWDEHYRFEVPSASSEKWLGEAMKTYWIINVVIPLLYTYAKYQNNQQDSKWFDWLMAQPAEHNHIIRTYRSMGWKPKHAGHTQAWIHLMKHYCEEKKCLDCTLGQYLLKYQAQ